mmetsp:Transcript_42114/g.87995  ORF Transcript_42114/g.87995 Transcript_42114/m.87995 type:complete len:207 (+) Transcript_42114:106-726(+)
MNLGSTHPTRKNNGFPHPATETQNMHINRKTRLRTSVFDGPLLDGAKRLREWRGPPDLPRELSSLPPPSAGVLHAGGDGLNGDDHGIPQLLRRLLVFGLGISKPLEHFRLDHMRDVQEWPSHRDGLLHHRVLGQQLLSSFDLENVGDGLLKTFAQMLRQLLQVVFFQSLGLVMLGQVRLGLSELDVNQVEHGLEHGPLLVHFLEEG